MNRRRLVGSRSTPQGVGKTKPILEGPLTKEAKEETRSIMG